MSHQMVGGVIDCLLTDADLRIRFSVDPLDALLNLSLRGLELTAEEIEVFMQTDARTWVWSREIVGHRVH